MYRDNSLIPTEAIRLAALGTLARGERRYGDLARGVREFAQLVVGPSLDLLGTSLELLRFEGLIEAVDGRGGMAEDALVRLTPRGREVLEDLLTAAVRPQVNDLNRLVIALKLRFLDLLAPEDRAEQVDGLVRALAGERARLAGLADRPEAAEGALGDWIAAEIAQVDARLAWCRTLAGRLG